MKKAKYEEKKGKPACWLQLCGPKNYQAFGLQFFASYHFHEMQKCRVRISIVIIV